MKKYWHIWVGTGILLLSILTVLGVVFLPRLAAKSDMEDLLRLAAAPEVEYVMFVDPTYEHPGILAGQGREVRFEGEIKEQVQAKLAEFAEDFSYEKKDSATSGSFGMHLLIKTAEGEFVKIYFAEETFYAQLKGSTYYFKADDAQNYTAFYEWLPHAFQIVIK